MVRTWDYETSRPEEREGDYRFAALLADRGSYYKVQYVDENGITTEWK